MILRNKTRLAVDQRHKIKLGYKGLSSKGMEIPKRTEYFVVANPESGETYFPELVEFYGSEPKMFYITFPSNNPEDFYSDNYVLYNSANIKKRQCDGMSCSHYVDETIQNVKYSAGTDTECVCKKHGLFETEDKELKKSKCSPSLQLKAFILHPETMRPISPVCYMFASSSINSAENIFGELYRIDEDGTIIRKYSRYTGFPFMISVKMIKQPDKIFPVITLLPYIPPEQLIDFALNFKMQITGGNGSQKQIAKSVPVMLEAENIKAETVQVETVQAETVIPENVETVFSIEGALQLIKSANTLERLNSVAMDIKKAKLKKADSDKLNDEYKRVKTFLEIKIRIEQCFNSKQLETAYELRNTAKGLNDKDLEALTEAYNKVKMFLD